MSNDVSTHVPKYQLPVRRKDPTTVAEEYTRLLHEEKVCPVTMATGDPAWLVTTHEDLKTVLADRRFSRAAMCADDAPRSQAIRPSPDMMLNTDPPRHTRIRQVAARAFSAERIARFRPELHKIVIELLDGMAALTPPVDLIKVFALPLPLRIICGLFGIPDEDRAQLVEWTEPIMTFDVSPEDIADGYAKMRGYFVDILAEKRENPGDDVLSALAASRAEDRITEAELIGLCTLLLVSGHETSITTIAGAALNLIRYPDQLAALRADPSLMPNAIEEILRYTLSGLSPFPRIATKDVVLSGVPVPMGSAVIANYETALRDEAVFDDPGTFDVRRKPASQVFFGHGPHFCLGAPVARLELEIAVWELFERFPTLDLAVPVGSLRWKDTAALGNWETLPVTWTTARPGSASGAKTGE